MNSNCASSSETEGGLARDLAISSLGLTNRTLFDGSRVQDAPVVLLVASNETANFGIGRRATQSNAVRHHEDSPASYSQTAH